MSDRKRTEQGRQMFNFYKSYYDVFKTLDSDKDKLEFISALLERQFFGTEPVKLSKMANFAYISQKHNIDAQVKGFEDKIGRKLNEINPTVGGSVGGSVQSQPESQPESESKSQTQGQEKKEFPALPEFLEYCKTITEFNYIDYEYALIAKYEQWVGNNWRDGHEKKIKNWKTKIKNTYPYLAKSKNTPPATRSRFNPTDADKW